MFKNLRWIIVFLLFMVYMINYLDRVALSITVPMIEKELTINPEQFGLIFGSFFFGYAISVKPSTVRPGQVTFFKHVLQTFQQHHARPLCQAASGSRH